MSRFADIQEELTRLRLPRKGGRSGANPIQDLEQYQQVFNGTYSGLFNRGVTRR
jgi:hypothetical protein